MRHTLLFPMLGLLLCSLPAAAGGPACTVAGKVTLDPPFVKGEQILGLGAGRFESAITLRVSDRLPNEDEIGNLIRFGERLTVKLGEVFVEEIPCNSKFVLRGEVMMTSHRAGGPEFAFFHFALKLDLKPGKINYLGTIRLNRDAYFDTVKLEILDESATSREAILRDHKGEFRKALPMMAAKLPDPPAAKIF